MQLSFANDENFSTRYKVVADEGFENTVILDGVPIIDNARRERLLTKISKEFTKRGSTISADSMNIPWDGATGKSKGCVRLFTSKYPIDSQFARYIFMEFKTREDADYAINAMNNVPFDSKHTFRLNHFLDVEKYTEMDPTYVEPRSEVYKPSVGDCI